MDIFKLAVMSLEKKILTVIMIVLELAALFFAGNYTICAVNERTMLSEPYKNILTDSSIFFYDLNYSMKLIQDDTLTPKRSQDDILEKLEGNFTVYNFLHYGNNEYTNYSLFVVADELYKALKLPLSSGSYGRGADSAVAAMGISMGELDINTPDGSFTLNICGNLTENTFIPESTTFKNNLTAADLYTATNNKNMIITSKSAVGDYVRNFNECSFGFIVKFDSPADAEKNMPLLRNEGSALSGSIIAANSENELLEDLKSYLPTLFCIFLIVVTGLICISAIIFDESKYRSGVLWICGYSKKKIAAIQAASISVLLSLSAAVFAVLSIVLNVLTNAGTINADSFIKLNFGLPNFIFTLAVSVVLILISAAIPFVRLFKKSPIEYLGRAK